MDIVLTEGAPDLIKHIECPPQQETTSLKGKNEILIQWENKIKQNKRDKKDNELGELGELVW